jgi:hypothetical protein
MSRSISDAGIRTDPPKRKDLRVPSAMRRRIVAGLSIIWRAASAMDSAAGDCAGVFMAGSVLSGWIQVGDAKKSES